jgi:hypothetical protein
MGSTSNIQSSQRNLLQSAAYYNVTETGRSLGPAWIMHCKYTNYYFFTEDPGTGTGTGKAVPVIIRMDLGKYDGKVWIGCI